MSDYSVWAMVPRFCFGDLADGSTICQDRGCRRRSRYGGQTNKSYLKEAAFEASMCGMLLTDRQKYYSGAWI